MKRSDLNSKTNENEEKDYATIESYGISVTTLDDEVFLRVARV